LSITLNGKAGHPSEYCINFTLITSIVHCTLSYYSNYFTHSISYL